MFMFIMIFIIELRGDEQVIMLTRTRIMLVKNRKLKVEWEVLFSGTNYNS